MTAIEKATLSRAEARSLTDEVKGDAERLWRKLVELYEGDAHTTLGYSSWGAYFKAEFGGTERRGYQLLDAGKTLASLNNCSLKPANEAQARELAPLLDQPEKLREVWTGVVESNPTPTAADIRAAVVEVTPDFRPGTKVAAAPRMPLKDAARNVIRVAVREGRHYRIPLDAMEDLMRAAGDK